MKKVLLFSRILAGLVFVFSGFVKAIDPAGSAIKFEEYFIAFHFDFLVFAAMPLAIILSTAEFMIGLNLIAGLRMKITAWLLLIFMSYFTILTFILALTNPVSDCGCFGDAVKLTNWQTFWKNIVLLGPTLVIFLNRKRYPPFAKPTAEWVLSGMNLAMAFLLSVYCLRHQPLMDFRPYVAGTSIPDKMTIPEGSPMDQYETILVYQKKGIKQEFTESNFPWQDTTWKWVETRQKLISKGYEPPIHDFSITDPSGDDITQQVLDESGYTFLIIAPFLEEANKKGLERMNNIALRASELGFPVYCLTSSTNDQIRKFKESFQPAFVVCTTDETTLKTIIRANPGLLLLQKGTILAKWNFRDAPLPGLLQVNMLSVIIGDQQQSTEIFRIALLTMAVVLVYSFFILLLPSARLLQADGQSH